ncbi:Protein transport protein BET1 [Erysiphe neolycopersici]|uniref:Protein transport protein BET1 n=1 Tax=Erysiphe neolycopersici TaxID=212602 RepID=A0A420HKV9_9PEZI|nr:Protein transport protein BET1 [Erysiphe neolycopersici]
MSSRFGNPSLYQRSDPRNALFENYQPTSGVPDKKARKSPIPSGGYGVGARYGQNDKYDFGYKENKINTWSEGKDRANLHGFRAATPNQRGQYSNAILSSLESQNDSEVEGILGKVRLLKSMTVAIGDEIRESSALADMMNERFESTRVRLRGTMSRMLVMAQKTGVGWKVWLAFFVAVILLFWWVK